MGVYNGGKSKSGKMRSNPLRNAKKAGTINNPHRISKYGDDMNRTERKEMIKQGKKDARLQRQAGQ